MFYMHDYPKIFSETILVEKTHYISITVFNNYISKRYNLSFIMNSDLLQKLTSYLRIRQIEFSILDINDDKLIKGISIFIQEPPKLLKSSKLNILKKYNKEIIGVFLLMFLSILFLGFKSKEKSSYSSNNSIFPYTTNTDNTLNKNLLQYNKYISFDKNDIFYISKYGLYMFVIYTFKKIFIRPNVSTPILKNIQTEKPKFSSSENIVYNDDTPQTPLNKTSQREYTEPKNLFHTKNKSGTSNL